MKTEEYATNKGNLYSCDVDVATWEDHGKHKASVCIGEEYYESDPYKSQDLALCEVKGWLEGVKAKIEGTIQAIETRRHPNACNMKCKECKRYIELRIPGSNRWFSYCNQDYSCVPCSGDKCEHPKQYKPIKTKRNENDKNNTL